MEFLGDLLDRGGFCYEADDIFAGGDPDASYRFLSIDLSLMSIEPTKQILRLRKIHQVLT
jgi:hypothetical protein